MDTGIPEHFCMAKTTDLWLKRSPESKVPDSETGFLFCFGVFGGDFVGCFCLVGFF